MSMHTKEKIMFLFLPFTLLYDEMIFQLLTVRTLSLGSLVYILLFSISFGCMGTLFCRLLDKINCGIIAKAVLIFLSAFLYIVEYFVYRQFKVFYDVSTVTAGAGDAVGGFTGDILAMAFSASGLAAILFFLAPGFLYIFVLRRFETTEKASLPGLSFLGLASVASYLLCALLIHTNESSRLLYTQQYNFQAAVSEFGLMTGIRKDIQKNLSGDDSLDFEAASWDFSGIAGTVPVNSLPNPVEPVEEEPVVLESTALSVENISTDMEEKTITPQEPVEYGYNRIDIDFDALANSGSETEARLDQYVASLTPSRKNAYTGLFQGKNLIFITAEAFTEEVIDEELTPTLYRLATRGINFTDYYQPSSAGTTGGEYQNIFGMLPMKGGNSLKITADYYNYYTIGSQLDRLGYQGWAFHNSDYEFYSRHLTHNNLGYSEGFMGIGNGMEKLVTDQWPRSDLEMMQATLPMYIDYQPFNAYYMTVSGHSLYTRNKMAAKNWERVAHLEYSDRVKCYLACNLELEDALAFLVDELEAAGIAEDTVIVLTTDHFPYGLDDDGPLGDLPYLEELYGFNPASLWERDHSCLIIWSGCLEDQEPVVVDTPTTSLDILPTLLNLFGAEFDSRLLPGRDVFSDAIPLAFNSGYEWKTELGTYQGNHFYPADDSTEVPEGYVKMINAIVKDKITYCRGVLETDYFRHVFGNP